MLTIYEVARLIASPFLPAVEGKVRADLRKLLSSGSGDRPTLLDVGARASPYTIGLQAEVVLLDIPRTSEAAHALNLGFTERLLEEIRRRRSNVEGIVLEDMTRCSLPSERFDLVVSVEVIEHIEDDKAFLHEIYRVLKPGGVLYLTTPNGDYVENKNPDHRRHYRRDELEDVLRAFFPRTELWYGIKTGRHRYRGLRSLSFRHPWGSAAAMVSNLVSHVESRGLDDHRRRTAHLFARATKDQR